ncbi:MAG: hypothetical protein RBU30_20240, partial [Polyangia bacterium]|nr:hypothetical protein [Polyangia bacterium]
MSVFQELLFVAGMGLLVAIILFLFHYRRLENILHVLQDIRQELRINNSVQREWAVEDNFERKLRERASGILVKAKKEPEPARNVSGAASEAAEGAKEKPEPIKDEPAKAEAPAEAPKPAVEPAKPVAEAPKPAVEPAKPVVEAPKPAKP